ncbi:DALR anticodon-binding domain-containing protein [Streptomyces sp. 549]|uniref:arginine--tRNA ligase n=1 Tax=Streptomyces sp. 549 TaxID=3049076 RepID=UPI0024C2FFED|nr:arginine--tRNA ligase [Streptomyces sp. 549]MDK1474814.1 DALR anticodon-binding domain-containing protein [Streptomyces sp. 549]
MTPDQLSRSVLRSVHRAVAAGVLPATEEPDRVTLRKPPHGDADYASNIALRLAPAVGRPAREIAEILRPSLAAEPGVAAVAVAGAGFLNIRVDPGGRTAAVRALLAGAHRAPGRTPGARVPGPVPPAEDPAGDAARWAAATGTAPNWERRHSNPLFRVQYAHARTRALLAGARDLGLAPEPGRYDTRAEAALIARLGEAARVGGQAASRATGPEGGARLAYRLEAAADAFFDFHDAHPVLPRGDEKPEAAHRSRLALAEATGTVLAGGLAELGISAPNHL